MLPPPITRATCTPRACTSLICSAMEAMTSESRPEDLDPMRASPESVRRTLRYFGCLATSGPFRPGVGPSLARRVTRTLLSAILAEDEAREPPDPDVLAGFHDDVVDDVLHRHVRIADEGLFHEAEFLVELFHAACDDLLD